MPGLGNKNRACRKGFGNDLGSQTGWGGLGGRKLVKRFHVLGESTL